MSKSKRIKRRESIKTVGEIKLKMESVELSPNPKCKHCYGRGFIGYGSDGSPITCLCLRKKYNKAQQEHIDSKFKNGVTDGGA